MKIEAEIYHYVQTNRECMDIFFLPSFLKPNHKKVNVNRNMYCK